MVKTEILKPAFLIFFSTLLVINIGCSSDDGDDDSTQFVELTVNGTPLYDDGDDYFFGNVDGKFSGKDGHVERTFLWQNSLNIADYNADMMSSRNGFFEMEVKDADGNVILKKTLQGGAELDSFSGITSSGTSGVWSVTITLSSFDGDGKFSLREEN
ncbi:hypothetical protein [Salinimicrobium xinjiangense]|uniref:hypothetical protein n=1 Tax=Salinimicrobium xinjiangense TaxID=438596 RepID=UPI00041A6E78|nr:hypothetical protein [Salinimicrobium xinjiangense]